MPALSDNLETHARRPFTGRFAPSPTGRMHAGNIFAALVTWLLCRLDGGQVVLRIEDLDRERSRQEYAEQIMRDFESLGLTWDKGPYYQHDRDEAYAHCFQKLTEKGLVYPCFCTRADLKAASAPQGSEKWVYAGTCRNLTETQREDAYLKLSKEGRIGAAKRLCVPQDGHTWVVEDLLQGRFEQDLATQCGDFIVQRADGAFAYQLAVVVDDADQGINLVSRGSDLLSSSPQQRYLQHLLGLPSVDYAHVPLFTASDGRRLAKRDKDAAFDALLQQYRTPEGVLGHIAYVSGLVQHDCPQTASEILQQVSFESIRESCNGVTAIAFA